MVSLAALYLPWQFLLVSLPPLLVVSAAPVVPAPAAFVSLAVATLALAQGLWEEVHER